MKGDISETEYNRLLTALKHKGAKLVIDTETTSANTKYMIPATADNPHAEVLQVSMGVIDEKGVYLGPIINDYVMPDKQTIEQGWEEAQAVHHISLNKLKRHGAKSASEYYTKWEEVINAAPEIIGYNIKFDKAILRHAGIKSSCYTKMKSSGEAILNDSMLAFEAIDKAWRAINISPEHKALLEQFGTIPFENINKPKWRKLEAIADVLKVNKGGNHDSLIDIKQTAETLQKIKKAADLAIKIEKFNNFHPELDSHSKSEYKKLVSDFKNEIKQLKLTKALKIDVIYDDLYKEIRQHKTISNEWDSEFNRKRYAALLDPKFQTAVYKMKIKTVDDLKKQLKEWMLKPENFNKYPRKILKPNFNNNIIKRVNTKMLLKEGQVMANKKISDEFDVRSFAQEGDEREWEQFFDKVLALQEGEEKKTYKQVKDNTLKFIKTIGSKNILAASQSNSEARLLASIAAVCAPWGIVVKPGDAKKGTFIVEDSTTHRKDEYFLGDVSNPLFTTKIGKGQKGSKIRNDFNAMGGIDKDGHVVPVILPTGKAQLYGIRDMLSQFSRPTSKLYLGNKKNNPLDTFAFAVKTALNEVTPTYVPDTVKGDQEENNRVSSSLTHNAIKAMQLRMAGLFKLILKKNKIDTESNYKESQMNMMLTAMSLKKGKSANDIYKELIKHKDSFNAFKFEKNKDFKIKDEKGRIHEVSEFTKVFHDLYYAYVKFGSDLMLDNAFVPENSNVLDLQGLAKSSWLIPFDDWKYNRQQGTRQIATISERLSETAPLTTSFAKDIFSLMEDGAKEARNGGRVYKGLRVSNKQLRDAVKELNNEGFDIGELMTSVIEDGNILVTQTFAREMKDAIRPDKITITAQERNQLEAEIRTKMKNDGTNFEQAAKDGLKEALDKQVDQRLFSLMLGRKGRKAVEDGVVEVLQNEETGNFEYKGSSYADVIKLTDRSEGRHNATIMSEELSQKIIQKILMQSGMAKKDAINKAREYLYISGYDTKGGLRFQGANTARLLKTAWKNLQKAPDTSAGYIKDNSIFLPQELVRQYKDTAIFKTFFNSIGPMPKDGKAVQVKLNDSNFKLGSDGDLEFQGIATDIFSEAKKKYKTKGLTIDALMMFDELNHLVTGEKKHFKSGKDDKGNRVLFNNADEIGYNTEYRDLWLSDIFNYGRFSKHGAVSLQDLASNVRRTTDLYRFNRKGENATQYEEAVQRLLDQFDPESKKKIFKQYEDAENFTMQQMRRQNNNGATWERYLKNSMTEKHAKNGSTYYVDKDGKMWFSVGKGGINSGYNIDIAGVPKNYDGGKPTEESKRFRAVLFNGLTNYKDEIGNLLSEQDWKNHRTNKIGFYMPMVRDYTDNNQRLKLNLGLDSYGNPLSAVDNVLIPTSFFGVDDTGWDNEIAMFANLLGSDLPEEELIPKLQKSFQTLTLARAKAFAKGGHMRELTVEDTTPYSMMPTILPLSRFNEDLQSIVTGKDINGKDIIKNKSENMSKWIERMSTSGMLLSPEEYEENLATIDVEKLRKAYEHFTGEKYYHFNKGTKIAEQKKTYAEQLMPYLTVQDPKMQEAIEQGKMEAFNILAPITGRAAARNPFLKRHNDVYTHNVFASRSIAPTVAAISGPMAELFKGDFDGDRIAIMRLALEGDMNEIDDQVRNILIKESERIMELLKIGKSDSKSEDETTIANESTEGLLLDPEFRRMISAATRIGKQGVGLFSNIARGVQGKIDETSYAERGFKNIGRENGHIAYLDQYKNLDQMDIIATFFESLEQDSISAKKWIDRYSQATTDIERSDVLSQYFDTILGVTDLMGKFISSNDNDLTVDQLVESMEKLDAVDKEHPEAYLKGGSIRRLIARTYSHLETYFNEELEKTADPKVKQQLLDDRNKYMKEMSDYTFDQLTEMIQNKQALPDAISKEHLIKILNENKQQQIRIDEWIKNYVETMKSPLGKERTNKIKDMKDVIKKWEAIKDEKDEKLKNYKYNYSPEQIEQMKKEVADYEADEKLYNDYLEEKESISTALQRGQRVKEEVLKYEAEQARIAKVEEAKKQASIDNVYIHGAVHNTTLTGDVAGSGGTWNEVFTRRFNQRYKDFKDGLDKDFGRIIEPTNNITSEEKARALGFASEEEYKQAVLAASSTQTGTYIHKINEVLSAAKNHKWKNAAGMDITSIEDLKKLKELKLIKDDEVKEYDGWLDSLDKAEKKYKAFITAGFGINSEEDSKKLEWQLNHVNDLATDVYNNINHYFGLDVPGKNAYNFGQEIRIGNRYLDPVALERRKRGENVTVQGYNVANTLDRVIQSGGTGYIIDYKTSTKPKDEHAVQFDSNLVALSNVIKEITKAIETNGEGSETLYDTVKDILEARDKIYNLAPKFDDDDDDHADPTNLRNKESVDKWIKFAKDIGMYMDPVTHQFKALENPRLETMEVRADRFGSGGTALYLTPRLSDQLRSKYARGERYTDEDLKSIAFKQVESFGESAGHKISRWDAGMFSDKEIVQQDLYIKNLKEIKMLESEINDENIKAKTAQNDADKNNADKASKDLQKKKDDLLKVQQGLENYLQIKDANGNIVSSAALDHAKKRSEEGQDKDREQAAKFIQKQLNAYEAEDKYIATKKQLGKLEEKGHLNPEEAALYKYLSLVSKKQGRDVKNAKIEAGDLNLLLGFSDKEKASVQEQWEKIKELLDAKRELNEVNEQEQTLLGTLGRAWKNYLRHWMSIGVMYQIMGKIKQAIQKVIQSTQQLDQCLTNIRIVTGKTQEDSLNLMKSYSKLGQTLSATTSQVAKAANDWFNESRDQSKINPFNCWEFLINKIISSEAF